MLFTVLPHSELSSPETEPQDAPPQTPPSPRRRFGLLLLAILLCLSSLLIAISAVVVSRKHRQFVVPGIVISGQPLGTIPLHELPKQVHALGERYLEKRVRLLIGHDKSTASLRELGLRVDEESMLRELSSLGHSGEPLADLQSHLHGKHKGFSFQFAVSLDVQKSHQFLIELKDVVDRAAVDARLDLEKHTIAPERPGYLLRVYDSLVSLEYMARTLSTGQALPEVRLAVAESQPVVRKESLGKLDVKTVLASWETRYSTASIDSDRTYNLKVGADKLNGYVLQPGQVFSFNAAVGDRTEKEGYRVAPVISGGELIDGLAGGMCQIASTLHAAAFFAGLEIVRSTPHSRPSTYIPMGLDSTVVYPSVDLKLKSPFDFPVVIHYVVHQGVVRVELLGKERVFKVAFEREILVETPFATVTRPDPEMPTGQQFIEQDGYPGYRIKRRRYIFQGKWKTDPQDENRGNPEELISRREWDLGYPATTQFVRVGTGSPKLPKKTPPPSHRIPPLPKWAKPLWVIER
ncbi:MAG TPA: VanW family protein [Pseudomonadota bacterium]|nr:VanW family protein [Pseudomonadota bacterium]